MNTFNRRVLYNFSGHVQGVGFRFFVLNAANELNITGYARNLNDGSVEVLAEGYELDICEFQRKICKGPSRSVVEKIVREELPGLSVFKDFTIR